MGIKIVSLWNIKAQKWVNGRKHVFSHLKENLDPSDKIIWIHCSSAGEFEQAKPIIENLKISYPGYKVLVSFFSPSGYETALNYKPADLITYLPLDTRENARDFIQLVHPELIIFIKYEFWYHHLRAAAFRHTPLLLISAVFRKEQVFFRWYGGFYKQILYLFRHIFVQDNHSLELLNDIGIFHCSLNGDTRFDRVREIKEKFTAIPLIEKFIQNSPVLVAGSTWSDDEEILSLCENIKMIIAPHEINEIHIQQIEKIFPDAVRYSSADSTSKNTSVLIIDNVGMLSRLYYYATITYIGGGFTRDGIHNTLEAAVYGKPVIFGPNYKKYREAKELIERGAAFSIENATELKQILNNLLNNRQLLQDAGNKAEDYITGNTGATEKLIQFIQANRLLTR